MTIRFPIALTTVLGLLVLTAAAEPVAEPGVEMGPVGPATAAVPPPWGSTAVSDSARDELAVGRYWHAARLMRAEGAAEGSPADRILLARAEAGWENWSAVLEILQTPGWREHDADGAGTYLLGRAQADAEQWAAAAATYHEYERLPGATYVPAEVVAARRVRAGWHAGDREAALAGLAGLRATPFVRSWIAAELALAAAEEGDPAGVRALRVHAVEPGAAGALWRAEADALVSVGDSTAAATVFGELRRSNTGVRRATASVELGRLLAAAGDTATGRTMLLEVFPDAVGESRTRAAASLIDLRVNDFTLVLELASILNRAGDGARALRGYDRAWRIASESGLDYPEFSRLERARLMGTIRDRQGEALEEFRSIRETTENERIGARNLEVWAQMRARQGQTAAVTTLRGWLLAEYPGSGEAAEVAWEAGSNAEAAGRLDRALEHYAFLAENVRTHERAGQARMRAGQIHLRRGDRGAAAEVFEAYLTDFPDGRRWQEAAYWAGRTRLELGDTARAQGHLTLVLTQPVEYYAVMAADLLDVPFTVNVPPGEAPTEPGWLTEGLARLDVLTESGLDRGAASEIDRLRDRAGKERGPRLRLASALIERGRTIDGINLGWALLSDEGSWDQEILRVAYPFPYRELVRREAAEWGVDPFMMAAIIRQESAFKADIVSHAGAIGLMQVMPPTGAELARTHGPRGFTRASLTRPEVNLHLGAAFFVDMSRRYDDDLPLVLSAYNAGPTRATRWRAYPEASDPLRFTERIPFTETRGYVKNVRRNLGLYRALYGQD